MSKEHFRTFTVGTFDARECNFEPKVSWLKFQVGTCFDRPNRIAQYVGKEFKGYAVSANKTSVFRLLGCGATLAEAEFMARGAK